MTLSDLASIGTLVSGVAVTLSLIFVLLQMPWWYLMISSYAPITA